MYTPQGHWLADRIARVRAIEDRAALLEALGTLVAEVGAREGVDGCFAAHEGLLVAVEGRKVSFEAVAAMAQHGLEPAREAAEGAGLGPLRQLLLVGDTGKLALFLLGPLTFGIVAPAAVDLGGALAR